MKKLAWRGKKWLCGLLGICIVAGHAPRAVADSPNELEQKARGALSRLYRHNPVAAGNVDRAFAILVFPEVRKLALGIGVETATGILFQKRKPLAFYNLTGFSCGLELGIQKCSHAIFFMDEGALAYLYDSRGLELGGSPALIVADRIFADSFSTTACRPGILAFTFHETGLMLDFGIHVSKITEYEPSD